MKPRSPLLFAGFYLLAAAPVHATDFVVCNKGARTGWAALAHRNGSGLFTVGHTWKVSGWYKVDANRCETLVSDSDGEPIYLAVSFTDALGDWGAFVPRRPNMADASYAESPVVDKPRLVGFGSCRPRVSMGSSPSGSRLKECRLGCA